MNEYNIDDIMRKDATERTAEEIEYMIEWKAAQKFRDDNFIKQEQERTALYQAIIDEQKENLNQNRDLMQQMVEESRKRLARIEEGAV